MVRSKVPLSESVCELSDDFLSLFPHRFDYLWAPYPDYGQTPAWQTETRHPLSDRLIQQGSYLYGVRFGSETRYCLLDIDAGSPYHPQRDPFAISRITAALEAIGIVSWVACTSSYSGGLHLYFPFIQPQSSWKLAIAVTTLIERAGFKVSPGQLEVFPDPKPYRVTGSPNLFNGHRLPLQIGSYLVDEEFAPIWGTQQTFVQQWQFAQSRNQVETSEIRRVLKQIRRHQYAVSTRAEKFINDLNAEIEFGWTGFGQTNRLLGRITMREYIFHHVLVGGQPLAGESLVDSIIEIAESLPGYQEYCRHRHEIRQRAEEWARCIEGSHYFHYGNASGRFKPKAQEPEQQDLTLEAAIAQVPNWNQQQSEAARDRIKRAIVDLEEKQLLPGSATSRYRTLLKYGIGGQTLYRHRDLWHPAHPPNPPATTEDCRGECQKMASPPQNLTSLFPYAGSDALPSNDSSDFASRSEAAVGSDTLSLTGLLEQRSLEQDSQSIAVVGVQYIREVLSQVKQQQISQKRDVQAIYQQQQQLQRERAEARYRTRMQQYLNSGDPILKAEALSWLQKQGQDSLVS